MGSGLLLMEGSKDQFPGIRTDRGTLRDEFGQHREMDGIETEGDDVGCLSHGILGNG